MEIRNDFKEVDMLLSRLVQFASSFREYNSNDWPHLKNGEDFRYVFNLDWKFRGPLEEIYGNGRDIAISMSHRLVEFNNPSIFPTLAKFVDSFDNECLHQVDILKSNSQRAKDICKELEHTPWAVKEMIKLYDWQIEILLDVKQTIDALRESDLYKWEKGTSQLTYPVPEYTKILDCVHSVGIMFERHPRTYSGKDEESLRDHILVALQGRVAGSATGESFNKKGKTDILVRNGDKNEFVGECKFWRGKSVYLDTISQLLSYISWRDTNAAVIIFVPNDDFGAVVDKVSEYTSEHPNYVRAVSNKDQTWHNYEFKMNEDQSRLVNVAVMLYHVPPIS